MRGTCFPTKSMTTMIQPATTTCLADLIEIDRSALWNGIKEIPGPSQQKSGHRQPIGREAQALMEELVVVVYRIHSSSWTITIVVVLRCFFFFFVWLFSWPREHRHEQRARAKRPALRRTKNGLVQPWCAPRGCDRKVVVASHTPFVSSPAVSSSSSF
jgi:hypothetical protein